MIRPVRYRASLLLLAIAAILGSWSHNVPAAQAKTPRPVRATAIVAVTAKAKHVAAAPDRTLAQIEAIASTLSGEPVTIDCLADAAFDATGHASADAYVLWDTLDDGTVQVEPVIYIRRQLCVDVESLGIRGGTYSRQRYPSQVDLYSTTGPVLDVEDGRAVAALAHEATHIRMRSQDEALVECTNEQNRWAALKLWQLPSWLASRVYWGMRWHHEALPVPYQNDC